eukprot:TRINITY_DN676_c2_g1_i1.p1 TRINITY_DN676_c2_g1~~TRINITY_DN676_c2_g1_i1.p1  ORF type:complete len:151 (+),score=20.15 TRINITY_DN676_c2_g1_i1:262-714(+)
MHPRDSASADESLPSQSQTLEITNPPIEEKSDPSFNPNGVESSESDALARSISVMLCSVIRDFDHRSDNVTRSQDQLSSSIDRLTRELDQLLDDAPLPFIMQHAAKISGVRKRVSSLNAILKSIQRRIDNVDRLLSAGISHEKPTPKNAR